MTIQAIVLAVNNPSRETVDAVARSLMGSSWKAVWCDSIESLSQLPPANRDIAYVVMGERGSLTDGDIEPYLPADRADVALYPPNWLAR